MVFTSSWYKGSISSESEASVVIPFCSDRMIGEYRDGNKNKIDPALTIVLCEIQPIRKFARLSQLPLFEVWIDDVNERLVVNTARRFASKEPRPIISSAVPIRLICR